MDSVYRVDNDITPKLSMGSGFRYSPDQVRGRLGRNDGYVFLRSEFDRLGTNGKSGRCIVTNIVTMQRVLLSADRNPPG